MQEQYTFEAPLVWHLSAEVDVVCIFKTTNAKQKAEIIPKNLKMNYVVYTFNFFFFSFFLLPTMCIFYVSSCCCLHCAAAKFPTSCVWLTFRHIIVCHLHKFFTISPSKLLSFIYNIFLLSCFLVFACLFFPLEVSI